MQSYLENDHQKANQPTSQAVLHQFPTYLYLTSYQTEPGCSLSLSLSFSRSLTSHLSPPTDLHGTTITSSTPSAHHARGIRGSVDLLLGCRYYLLGTVLGM